ncbi:MAG: YggU family protein [Chlamydiales bacterium]|nr:YggU family protein [Chlamydiales bacterium]
MILMVKVTPNSRKNSIEGYQGDVLRVKIKAPPDKGKANEELIEFLAETFKISKSQITLISGHSSRLKKLKIEEPIRIDLKRIGL